MTSIRPAKSADATRISELYEELDEVHRLNHPNLYRTEKFIRDPAEFEAALNDSKIGLLVAETLDASPTVVGLVHVVEVETPDGKILAPRRFGLVDGLIVAASHRKAGVGSELLLAAEDWARARGLNALEVTVWAFNGAAQRLYDQHGFAALRHYLRKDL